MFDLSLGQMLWSRRSVFLGLLVGAPIILAVVVRIFALAGRLPRQRLAGRRSCVFGVMMWLLFVRFVVPVLGVFYGTR